MTDATISRQIPLEQLIPAETDVRQGRDPDKIRSLASSMGDPEIGQQQPIAVYPKNYPAAVEDGTEDELAELFEDGHDMVIHDGLSRFRAAQSLGWSTLWAVILPEPPENEVVARLEANTESLDMADYEVYTALYDHYQESDATLEDIGEKIGVSASYVSNVFGLFDSPEFVRKAWATEAHPLETSHALAIRGMLSEGSVDEYAQAGGIDDGEARERAKDDARLMIDVQAQHDLGVTDFRARCKRCRKETIDQLQDQRTLDERQADGQAKAAEDRQTPIEPEPADPDPCQICGSPADRKIAVDVCREDYGMLSEMKANGEVLMDQAGGSSSPAEPQGSSGQEPTEAAEALAAAAGISPDQAAQVVQQVQQEASQAQGGRSND